MKKIILSLFVVLSFFSSCTDDFEAMNTDKKHPALVPGEFLFSNAQKSMADQISECNVNLNIWVLWAQYWTETTYVDEANYDLVNRTIPDNTFRQYYRGFLNDLQEARILIAAVDVAPALEPVKQNKLHIITLLECYAYQHLVDIFGNVPYSQALDIENTTPVYDDAATIYADLINRVTAAANGIDVTAENYGGADLIYGGSSTEWKRFGYSLLLKLGIALADVNNTLAQSTVEAAVTGGVFTSNADNALFAYEVASPNANQLYENLVASGRHDFVACNTIVDMMLALNDPRIGLYFTLNADNIYLGGTYGESSPFALYSHVADVIQQPNFPAMLMTYSEILFYIAEAAERGYNVGMTAAAAYEAGIRASIEFWGGSTADADTYLAQPSVAYATATGTWQQKIGTQSWLANYIRGLEAYNTWRRLDYPILNIAPILDGDYSQIPVRFTYPINEQTLNKANYTAAVAALGIGGDQMTTKLFWDLH